MAEEDLKLHVGHGGGDNDAAVTTATKPKVYVASRYPLEIRAVRNALPEDKYEVVGCDTRAEAHLDKQLLGLQMIELGARHRLSDVPQLPRVAFETGMVLTTKGYHDVSCCILQTNLGDFYSWTTPRECLPTVVSKWLALDGEARRATKWGSLIFQHDDGDFPHCSWEDSWYGASTLGIFSKSFGEVWAEFVRASEQMPTLDIKLVQHKGVPFIDIQHNLLHQPMDLAKCVWNLSNRLLFDVVMVADARGFLLAGEFMKRGIRVVLARKPNKLPSEVHTVRYNTEYGTDELCIEKGAVPPNSRVLLVDDVVAKGGTMGAMATLVRACQSSVAALVAPFAIESAPGNLLLNAWTLIPRELVRFAQTQFGLPKFTCVEQLFGEQDSGKIAIVPPSLHTFAPRMPRATVSWKQFACSSNITFDGEEFKGKDVTVYLNTTDQCEMYDVLSLLRILYRKDPNSVSVIIPFCEHGTQDRVEYKDDGLETLAQIDTLAKMIGKHKVTTYDVHAEQSLMIFHDMRNVSLVAKLWQDYHFLHPNAIAVFPDDGAAKRFAKKLGVASTCIIFRKTRGRGDERFVETENATKPDQDYVIIDDLVRSGSTMKSVAEYLLHQRHAKSVAALFAHAPLEPAAAKNMKVFRDSIWTSSSCGSRVPSNWVRAKF